MEAAMYGYVVNQSKELKETSYNNITYVWHCYVIIAAMPHVVIFFKETVYFQ